MKKLISVVVSAALLVLAVSVWQQLDPRAQQTLVAAFKDLWAGLVGLLARFVEQLVDAVASS